MNQNIFNISSNYNFLESVARFVLMRYPDPFYMANITILLPSRRACHAIKKIFLQQSKNQALILPKIKAIGDVDYDDLGINFFHKDDLLQLEATPISALKYNLLLIDEIKKWNQKTNLFGKNITISHLAGIAANLQKFLDEVEKENLDLDNLENAEDTEHAGHKQQILKFLRHFGSNFRNILAKNNTISVTTYRNKMIEFAANYLNEKGTNFPIIAAGSTGSVAATAQLLKAIANQKNCHLILYGLDKNLSEENLEIISEFHPQYMLKKLLNFLEINFSEVQNLNFEEFKLVDDENPKLLSSLMLPASKTNEWINIKNISAKAINNLTKIETKNNFDEAKIISLIIREKLIDKNKNIALVTNDKNLALMVKMNLQKWQINIDDSKNNNLSTSKIVNYLLSIAEIFNGEFKSLNLLSVLKHPLTIVGNEEKFHLHNLRLLELKILRNGSNASGFDDIKNKISQFGDEEFSNWFEKIVMIFSPLKKLFAQEKNDLKDLLIANIKCAEELSKNFSGDNNFYNQEGAEEFIEFYQELFLQNLNFEIENESYRNLILHLLKNYNFFTEANFHPRLHILSTIETRLMNYDVMIISGLNEGEFPNFSSSENWLGKKMRHDFGLSDLSRKIGVAAYDFCNYLSGKEVVMIRANNKDNAPTVESRFLMKLDALLKTINLENYLKNGANYKEILKEFAEVKILEKITRPMPAPLHEHRLKKISVTDVKKWIKDPYYIYAKRILNLKALDKIDKEPSFAEFGNFVHLALENFIKNYEKINEEDRLRQLLEVYGKQAFEQYFPTSENKLLWWPRFENIASWFVKNEELIREKMQKTFTEMKGEMEVAGVIINTTIDRINIDKNNEITILDYKTGSIPTNSQVKKGYEPQLAIEALIISLGKVNESAKFSDYKITNLQYYKLKGQDQNLVENLSETEKLILEAKQGLTKLITIFNDEKMPFISCPNPDLYEEKYNDYHHLSRIDEWE